MTPAPDGAPPALSADEARALAQQHGLERLGGRPPFGVYVRRLWQRRSFLWTLSRAQASSKNADDRLGVLWHLLNPLFLVVSYFLIFGLLLETRRGVDNFIAFLSIGVVVFGFSSSAITTGSELYVQCNQFPSPTNCLTGKYINFEGLSGPLAACYCYAVCPNGVTEGQDCLSNGDGGLVCHRVRSASVERGVLVDRPDEGT
mgnify:CR=1 FL=1